ncbi:MAG: ABC transporter ATP-binding protein [Planctomycetaceae bacterium]|nr:ABC transporter ATP-binding protein [Planctomycetaceae bacterium]
MTMQRPATSSQRFQQYRLKFRQEQTERGGKTSRRRERSALDLIRAFLRMLHGHWSSMSLSLITLTIATGLALLPPVGIKAVVDYVLGSEPLPAAVPQWVPREKWPLLVTITVGVLLISLVKTSLHVWGRWHATKVTKLLQMSLRKQVFERMLRLPLHRIHDLRSGGAASILRQDAGSVGDLVFGMIYNPWRALIQLLGSLLVLAWVDWRLLFGASLLIPIVYFSHRTWISRIRPQFRQVRTQREEVDSQATETFGGIRIVRGFSQQHAETNRNMRGNHLMGRQELYAWWWMRGIEIVWETVIPLSSAGLLIYGGWQVLNGHLSLGDLMMFLVYLLMLLDPLAVLAQSAATFQNSLSGLDRVLDLLDEPLEMSDVESTQILDDAQVSGRVVFDQVNFTYPAADQPALVDCSLDVAAGETIALVGPSGAGKTTLCNLVARFYDPDSGSLLLDGVDLKQIDVESYRRIIGIVEQDVFLFDGSVAMNIGYGKIAPDMDQVRHAAQVANAAEFIEKLPQQYETIIGERGVKLSGGQRQRLAIARAILADPKILILDEATSNLDTESERLIQASLTRLMQNRTCFVIAHRLSTIRNADRIVVLQEGKIREVGTHDQLMATDGMYREMVRLQTEQTPEQYIS